MPNAVGRLGFFYTVLPDFLLADKKTKQTCSLCNSSQTVCKVYPDEM